MRKPIFSLRKKFVASLLATLIVLTPTARAQQITPEDLFFRTLNGLIIVAMVLTFARIAVGSPYAEGREGADREKSIKDKEKFDEQEVTFDIYDDWLNIDGLSPAGDVDPMEGTITTKNNKTYKIASYVGNSGEFVHRSWVQDFIAANGSETAQVDFSSMKGKLKMNKDGTVKFKMIVKYKGTVSSGNNFGGKAKGKMKFKGTADIGDPID